MIKSKKKELAKKIIPYALIVTMVVIEYLFAYNNQISIRLPY